MIYFDYQPKEPHNCLGFYSEVCQPLLVSKGIAMTKANTEYIEVSLKNNK